MTHKKTTDADGNTNAAEQEKEQELVAEIEEALGGDPGEGSDPDDASLARFADDGAGTISPDDDDSEC